ncbi:MAG: LysM peptidoglycan-binding domain-containing protein [Caldilineaceae bacterium]|nr:LysM peptidoglycan-binding domain-containing protein [Caldilineaceae bacterium]
MSSPSNSIPMRLKASLAFLLASLMLVATLFSPASSPLFAQSGGDSSAEEATAARHGTVTITYVVKRGDTLGAIARRYNTTIATLLRLNPQIRNPNRLYVGQRIRVPAPAAPEEPTGFTLTRIHLISLNDGGPLGCGDTLVPVTVEIPSTRAVLRASLDKLLSLRTPYYGESGLYNALYQSQLTLDDVRIDNRVATIRLSGQVVLGGVCDSPRVQAQLEQAALQFSTVDQVKIYLNGNLLQDVLSEK